jgi:hypothetical protein
MHPQEQAAIHPPKLPPLLQRLLMGGLMTHFALYTPPGPPASVMPQAR